MRLSNLGKQDFWTGAVISERGEILTTSEGLWNTPVVDVQLPDGTQGQACVTGRDDDIGLALLESNIEAASTHDFLTISSESPSVGDQLLLIQHSNLSVTPGKQATQVTWYKPFESGYSYFQMLAGESTADGAVLINTRGELQGIRMPQPWRQRHGIGILHGVCAVDSAGIAGIALPLLRTGRIRIDIEYPWYVGPSVRSPMAEVAGTIPSPLHTGGIRAGPLLPLPRTSPPHSIPWVFFIGEVTLNGEPAPDGSVLHVRVMKEGRPDYWESDTTLEDGWYLISVFAPGSFYNGGTVEFWMDCKRAPTTVTLDFDFPIDNSYSLNLAF